MRHHPRADDPVPAHALEFSAMSTLTLRRHAGKRVSAPSVSSTNDQLQTMRGALIAKASQPDSASNRAELKALALATAFVIDSAMLV